jgi:uncharacterized repeat protein (TIGR03943 family)
VSDRRTQGVMLLTVGGMALWLGLSDATLSYVRAWLRLPLAASGVVLLVLALATLRWGSAEDQEPAGHDHDHGHGDRGPRSAWLLVVPVLVLLLVAPPALGSYAASRRAPGAGGDPSGDFPALPEAVGGAVPLAVSDFVSRALYDRHQSLAGVRVRMLGFVSPADKPGDGYRLARFNFFCCAADAAAYEVVVRGDPTPRRADQWLLVEGRWLPEPPAKAVAPSTRRPVLIVDSVTPVDPPADRYEHNLFAF